MSVTDNSYWKIQISKKFPAKFGICTCRESNVTECLSNLLGLSLTNEKGPIRGLFYIINSKVICMPLTKKILTLCMSYICIVCLLNILIAKTLDSYMP